MDKKYITTSYNNTQKIGESLAKEILKLPIQGGAIVLCLEGNLGGGKTTFLQGFAKGLNIKQKILSPTFVIQKRFKIKNRNFFHIDCYRLKNEKDILELNFLEIIKNPNNILAIEWPQKIRKVLPKNTILINFEFIDNNTRKITIDGL